LPTQLVALAVQSPNAFAARLRAQDAPIVARVAEGKVMLDPRTVLEEGEAALLDGVRNVMRVGK
jgi:hypothetical protein